MRRRALPVLAVLGLCLAFGQPARAERKPRSNRPSKRFLAVEIKFGPYSPDIDSTPGRGTRVTMRFPVEVA